MASWGGSEEKGPACSAFTVYAVAHAVIDKDRAHATVSMPTTHTQKNTHTCTNVHMETWKGIQKVLQDSITLTSNSSTEICCHSTTLNTILRHIRCTFIHRRALVHLNKCDYTCRSSYFEYVLKIQSFSLVC